MFNIELQFRAGAVRQEEDERDTSHGQEGRKVSLFAGELIIWLKEILDSASVND